MNQLAHRITNLIPSPTIAIDTKAKALKQQGVPIINLSAGEPDFATPTHIKQAAIKALNAGFTKYAAPQGLEEFREAIAEKFKKDNHIAYDPSQIIVGPGSKQLLYTVFHVLCDPGDEVLIPIPNWSTFVEQVKLTGAKPILVKLTPPFKLTANEIKKHLTKKTKLIVLNSPSNPTGAMIDEGELQKIADLVIKHNLWIVSDEIYEKLTYTTKHISIASLNEKIKARTITINGVSKAYAMTGWRLGFAAGPQEISKAMTTLQSQMIGNVPTFIQKAALTALTEDQTSLQTMHKAFTQRRNYLVQEFSKIKNLSITNPEGAFYLFVSVKKLLNETHVTSAAWCEALLEKEHVALVPGEAFMASGYFRLSFAASMEDLKEAVKRIKRFITNK